MFAFGCSIIMPDVYERCARPGIERAREADSVVFAHAAAGSVARSFNLLLDRAARLPDLEGLVIMHEDAEILDPDFCARARAALRAGPDVGIVGPLGARGVGDIAWWDGEITANAAPYHYGEAGGGVLAYGGPAAPEVPAARPAPDAPEVPAARPVPDAPQAPEASGASGGEVDTLYGVLLVLSPWAVQNLRCDESVGMLHGYDFDLCRQARRAGRRVLTADLRVAHHHSLDLVTQIEIWVAAHMRAAELWDGEDQPGNDAPDESWRPRARRAEASAAAARLLAASKLLQADATAQRYARELESFTASRSWRMTGVLRHANAYARRGRAWLSRRAPGELPRG